MKLTFDRLASAVLKQGYLFFERGDYNLNLVGIRRLGVKPAASTFCDTLAVLFRQGARDVMLTMPCTTDPGRTHDDDPLTQDANTVLPPGQYPGMWRVGLYRGQYPALVQNSKCPVYRLTSDPDSDADIIVDYGNYAINCHRASEAMGRRRISRWSPGSQVVEHSEDYGMLMSLARVAATRWGNQISYTLLTDDQLQ